MSSVDSSAVELADVNGDLWTTIAEIRAATWAPEIHVKFPRGVPVWWARQRMQQTRQALGLRYQGANHGF